MRISDWSSDVCSSDLLGLAGQELQLVAAADAERLVAEPEQARLEQGGELGRVVDVAGDLAALAAELPVEGAADGLAGSGELPERRRRPGYQLAHPRGLVVGREQDRKRGVRGTGGSVRLD